MALPKASLRTHDILGDASDGPRPPFRLRDLDRAQPGRTGIAEIVDDRVRHRGADDDRLVVDGAGLARRHGIEPMQLARQ